MRLRHPVCIACSGLRKVHMRNTCIYSLSDFIRVFLTSTCWMFITEMCDYDYMCISHTCMCIFHLHVCISHIYMCICHIYMCISHIYGYFSYICVYLSYVCVCISHMYVCISHFHCWTFLDKGSRYDA